MALTFPLPLADFFGGLKIASTEFDLPAAVQTSRTRGGQVLQATLGNRLWRGRAQIVPRYHGEADAIRAKLSVLSEAGATFLACPAHRIGPQEDPEGVTLGAATPTIHTLVSGNRELRITGLPVGYALTAGDYLSFSYGSSPTRYAFHQLVSGGVADGAGLTPALEVTPHIRPGAVTGAAVVLVRPFFKAIMSGPVGFGSQAPLITSGISFDFVQTLGA